MSEKIINTIQILKKSEIEYEFRTTVIEQYHDKKEIKKIGELIKGARKYYLQSFIDSEYVIDHSLKPVSKEILVEYRNIISEYVESVEIRGVD